MNIRLGRMGGSHLTATIDASARIADTIVQMLLPEAGGALQYRVKAKINGEERVVREDQLDWLAV